MKRTVKEFRTRAVLGLYTGLCLEARKSSKGVLEVAQHLIPGITDAGVDFAVKNLRTELLRQHPEFAKIPDVPKKDRLLEQWCRHRVRKLGGRLEVLGPLDITELACFAEEHE